jgi:chromate transporter
MLITLALAWGDVRFGSLPAAEGLLYGIKPVIIAIVAQALLGLARSAVRAASSPRSPSAPPSSIFRPP